MAQNAKVTKFLNYLVSNKLVMQSGMYDADEEKADGLMTLETDNSITMNYIDSDGYEHRVLQFEQYFDKNGKPDGVLLIAADGKEHLLEEMLTPASLKKFEAFKQFRLPK